ncbi:hypothetical protein [Nonomuraea dietziae]|uniref:hypothetical protein n=1 Tax=Nonomuraea dietziae TaxID=65515 RepID=UPI0031D9A636
MLVTTERILCVETGLLPAHLAIRDDIAANLDAVESRWRSGVGPLVPGDRG